MPVSLIPTFLIYCFVTAITPGPANLCSLASAMTYGRKQALIQWRGIFIGYAIVAFVSSLAVWFLGVVVNKYIYVLPFLGGPVANLVWLFAGAGMKRFFEKYQKPVNIVMAISLVICAVSIVMN